MKTLLLLIGLFSASELLGQTLIMNEVSQGVTGEMEYVEFVVIDTTVAYDCVSGLPPSIDIRGWIFDDNSGYHGAVGVAPGCIRFSLDPFWSNIPLGTIILIYNDATPEPSIPADDLSMVDGNCLIVAPISDPVLFESNSTTPGAIACSYPAAGWTAGGNWSNTRLANTGDCARIVDLSGCERFSVCWGTANVNTQIFFAGSAANNVYWFNGIDPEDQANWSEGCTDDETVLDLNQCGSNDQTPGAPNNAANATYISSFNNGCTPIPPLVESASVDNDEICSCDGQATASGSGSIGPYTYEWFDATMTPIGQTTATATGLCAATYFVEVTSFIGCVETASVIIAPGALTDDATFTTTPTCDGGTAAISGTPGGTFTFTVAPGDGAVIDGSTGTVTGGTSGATYDITYTTSGTCPANSNVTVTAITQDDATFTATPTCDGGTATISGTIGGTFTFTVAPGDGAVIDGSTGTVTGGTSGATYDITYTTSGTCPANSNVTVTAIAQDDATFTTTPTCDGGIATISGTTGGTFTFTVAPGDGAVIDGSTGAVTGGTSGATYNVQYATSGACAASSTQSVTAITQDDATFTTTPTCDGGTATISGTTGGTFTFTVAPGDGAVIDGSTGSVTGGTSGTTYDITYTTSGTCPANSNASVIAITQDDATFTVTPACDGGTATISGTAGGTFAFTMAPGDGAVIDGSTGTVTGGTSGTTYDISYTTSGTCPASSSLLLNTLVLDDASFYLTATCDSATAIITGSMNGTFSFSSAPFDGALINPSNGTISNVTEGASYQVEYTTTGACSNSSIEFVVIEECFSMTIPSAFTPDADGVNDDWEILDIDSTYPENVVYVYNRWGNLLFTSEAGNYDGNRWDGTFNEKELPVGSYYYIIEFNDKDNNKTNGIVSIILNK